ncbi:TolC family protein [Pigmentibacter sp. JX0631]|uniref:TolC family protein n=1 Tax=Pigmentibacter sp. JX0631 TaxID=2976982 RepID=UPI0024686161|nr:TolC family protein [Pigmentibacter sp. JX0631]WGL58840.1 TolC family protein [Pigmentibacter sp. JX0631]
MKFINNNVMIFLIIAVSYNYQIFALEKKIVLPTLQIDLNSAMEIAEKNSLQLKSSLNEFNSTNFQHSLSYFQYGPTLDASADTTWYPKRDAMNLNSTQDNDRSSSVTLKITQPISNIWKNYYKMKELEAKKDAAAYDYNFQKINARISAAQSFLDAQQALNDLEIKKTTFENAAIQYKETSVLFETGDASKDKVDLLLSQANKDSVEIEVSKSQIEYSNKIENLKKVLKLSEQTEISLKPLEYSFFEKQKISLKELNVLLEESKNNRPDLKSLEKNLLASKEEITKNTFKFFPEISAFSSYLNTETFNNENGLNSNSNLSNSGSSTNGLTFGISMTWSIWDGGLNLAERSSLKNKETKNKVNYEDKIFDISEEVKISYNSLKNNLQILPQLIKLSEIYSDSYKFSLVKYKTGNLTASELIKSQNELLNAKISLAKIRGDIDYNWLKLQSAIGTIPSYSNTRLIK